MTKSIEAVFDGVTLRRDEPLDLPPNTRVRVTIESPPAAGESGSFLRTARNLRLTGPADWSSNLGTYEGSQTYTSAHN
jgi:hypothetical protein